jgi:hypothetical protein
MGAAGADTTGAVGDDGSTQEPPSQVHASPGLGPAQATDATAAVPAGVVGLAAAAGLDRVGVLPGIVHSPA